MSGPPTTRFREHGPERLDNFLAAGYRQRDFFPHRTFYLPKAGPDGYELARRHGLRPAPGRLWQIGLFAAGPALDGLPGDLFFDDEILWHRQHFGLPGHVAVAAMTIRGDAVHTAAHHSDLVQRISRRRHLKTRVEKRFGGWDRMLLNGILAFALERGLRTVRVPTAAAAIRDTDRARDPKPELFDRVYDRHVRDRFDARRDGCWWSIDVVANRHRIVPGQVRSEPSPATKTICVCHDVERGSGHRHDPLFAAAADAHADANLRGMLEVERERDVRATYHVVGQFLEDVRGPVEADGHALGFHSYDHDVGFRSSSRWVALAGRLWRDRPSASLLAAHQLGRCRGADYRLKGYRPPQSRLGLDTNEDRLAHFNFEWLASSVHSFGFDRPRMERGIVKLPILFDDFSLHRGEDYDAWEERALRVAGQRPFLAFSLHDCYAPAWKSRYPVLLEKIKDLGELKTLEQVAAEVTLAHAF